jgi:bacteriophage HK97-gp10 putative tail-component
MPEGITVRGIPEVQQNLKGFPRLLVLNCFRQALARAASVFEEELAVRAPETEYSTSSEDRGHLIDSIMSDITIDTQGRGGRVKVGFGKKDMVALWVEYGHRMLSHSGKPIGTVPAHPFIRPAFEAAADRAIEVFTETVQEYMQSGSAIAA